MEWGRLPAGKQVSLKKNAGRGQGKRAAQPVHVATVVPALPQRPETRTALGCVPPWLQLRPQLHPAISKIYLVQLIHVAFKLYSVIICCMGGCESSPNVSKNNKTTSNMSVLYICCQSQIWCF